MSSATSTRYCARAIRNRRTVADANLPAKVRVGEGSTPATQGPPSPEAQLSNGPETAPLPPSQNKEVHVQVDAPFVFSAKNRAAAPQPPPVESVRGLPVDDSAEQSVHLDPVIQSPPDKPADTQKKNTEHRGFFGRIGGFFSSIFK